MRDVVMIRRRRHQLGLGTAAVLTTLLLHFVSDGQAFSGGPPDGRTNTPGESTWDQDWNPTDREGDRVVSGTHLLSLRGDEGFRTRPIVLVK